MSEDDGNGRNGTNPSWPPLDAATLQGVLEHTIGKQSADEEWIQRVDDGVIGLQKSVDALSARTDKWQQETTAHLAGIDGRIRILTNQVFVIQMLKVGGPALLALFAGGFVGELMVWLLARH